MDGASSRHPSRQELSSYLLGKLDESAAEGIRKHLGRCVECRQQVEEMSADSFLGGIHAARDDDHTMSGRSERGETEAGGGSPGMGRPPANTLPPGLADHPDYEVIRELGRGGMGVVYLVENTLMGRKEVLKVVGSHLLNRPGIEERFLREIRSAAKLHHTNIVTAYRAMRIRESIVFAMEYVDGLDLAKLVKSKGPLQVTHACNFVYQAALGLQHALEHGMVHRDIKPSNLMLARDGRRSVIKVLDFGLAKVTSEGQADSGLTREGQMLGTPDFIAPEQIRDAQSADIRADVYSLGCTLYYLLAGRAPFVAEHVWDVYDAHFSMVASPLNLVRPVVPVEVAALAAKMMAKEPHRRFQTPGDVAQALVPFFKSFGSHEQVSSRIETRGDEPAVEPSQNSYINDPTAEPATPPTVPATKLDTPAKYGRNEVNWESLVQVEPDTLVSEPAKPEPVPAVPASRHALWRWRQPLAALLAGALSLIVLGVIVFTIKGSGREPKETLSIRSNQQVKAGGDHAEQQADSNSAWDGPLVNTKEAIVKNDEQTATTTTLAGSSELNATAWELATSSDAAKRDGTRAVELATKACEIDGYRTPTFLDTLAAAYAEAGNFDAAIKWQMRAIERNAPNGDNDEFRGRLGLYNRRKAYHQGDALTVVASPEGTGEPPPTRAHNTNSKKKLLAITESKAFPHAVSKRENGQPSLVERVLQNLGNAGGFDVVSSQDSRASISVEGLKEFDAVLFYTRGELPITPEGKAALLEFVRSGKGFAGCHCAADTLYEWPEYGELIGAYLGKNLGTRDLTVRLDDLAHPSTRDLDTAFRVHDELYQFKAPFARDKVHVLMHFDQPGVANGGAAAWTRDFGYGRVFYTSLGHDQRTWKDEGFQRHLLGGLCEVLRLKLPMDASPSPTRLAILNRHAAEAVLSLGGTVVIRSSANEMTIKPGGTLPQVRFDLEQVRLVDRTTLVDADLERLRGVRSIVEVNLRGARNVTDDGLERLQGLRRLEVLDLRDTRVSDKMLTHLRDSTQLRRLDLWRTQLTDAGVVGLSRFPKLEYLHLGARRVTGAGLDNLQGLTRLRELYFWDQNVPNASLANLKNLVQLETLELVGTPVNDEGLAHLKRLPNLRRLNLYHSGVTGTAFADPGGLGKLNWLSLRQTRTSDAGLIHVGKLVHLEWFDLADTSVTDVGLSHLHGLSRLGFLDLARTKISSAGLAHLRGLTQLKEINVDGTGVTAPAAEEFRRWLPSCRVAGTLAAVQRPPERPARNDSAEGFVSLFNGRDLTGWTDVLHNECSWKVSGGLLEGLGAPTAEKRGWLGSNRRDFKNFVLRVTLRSVGNTGGRILIRHVGADDFMRGYQVQAFGSGNFPIGRIGRAVDPADNTFMGPKVPPQPFPDDQWHTIEITAINNQFTSSLDGNPADRQVDLDWLYTSGSIGFICWGHLQIQEILIKKLPDDGTRRASTKKRGSKAEK